MTTPELTPLTDGAIRLRSPRAGDAAVLIGGRDAEIDHWLGPGSDSPEPVGCVEVDGELAGWVDYDTDRSWLGPGEVNVGYAVFPPHRHRGYATRAVQLLMHHLATRTDQVVATLLIDPVNHASLALARRAGFARSTDLDGQAYFKRSVPPLSYSDEVVSIRRPEESDLEADLGAKDDEQIRWMWLPGQRESWEAMTPDEQRAHAAGAFARDEPFGFGTEVDLLGRRGRGALRRLRRLRLGQRPRTPRGSQHLLLRPSRASRQGVREPSRPTDARVPGRPHWLPRGAHSHRFRERRLPPRGGSRRGLSCGPLDQ